MADVPFSLFPALGAAPADGDIFLITDVSTGLSVSVTYADLKAGISVVETDTLDSVVSRGATTSVKPSFNGGAIMGGPLTINDKLAENTGTTPAGTTPAISQANGIIQEWVLSGNSSPTDGLSDGQSVVLLIDDGAAYAITWPSVVWDSGSAPTLKTSGYTRVVLYKVGSTLRGAY